MAMGDSMQATRGSNELQNNPRKETAMEDKGDLESQSSPAVASSPREDDQPQAPTKRNRIETIILMSTLCVSLSIWPLESPSPLLILYSATKMAVFLAALDITIVSTAIPTISDRLHSTSGYAWIGSAFLLAAAVVAPSYGKLSDIWGRKSILLMANAIFFVGSAISGASVNISMLIVGRAVQGAGGGGLLSLVSIVIGDLFSQR